MAEQADELGFDPEALHRKYLEERDKRLRLRPEALDQYISVTGEFRDYAEDPYVDPGFTRDPLTDEVDVVVLGGGWCGVLCAVRLRQAGVDNVRIIEKGGDFGGNWYWNRYPGLRCDIESYIYLPLLEETGYIPTEKYARGSEIFEHFQRVGKHFDLYSNVCFQTQITEIRWDADISRWIVRTNRDDAIRARFVCLGGAGLHRPKLPGIPGIEDFRGRGFHSSRWDYDYTGGDEAGNLTKLADKRVAVIGTGATAIQVVPAVAEYAKQLYVVQRTASTVDARNNRPTDPEWAASLEPGWQTRRIINFSSILSGVPQDEDLVDDAWTDIVRKVAMFSGVALGSSEDAAQLADYRKMEEIRARIDSIVADPATAEALKPWYNYACKRPCFSDDYLQAFNKPNVTLINTDGHGLDRITEHGVEFDGKSYDVDCLIFATGFDTFLPIYETGEFEVIGRDGVTLAERWQPTFRSLHGVLMDGFPNLFIYGAKPHTASTANLTHIVGAQAAHIAAVIEHCLERDVVSMEVRLEAEDRWQSVINAKRKRGEAFYEECTPGYINYEGAKDKTYLLGESYGGVLFEYIDICAAWLEGEFDNDLELQIAGSNPAVTT